MASPRVGAVDDTHHVIRCHRMSGDARGRESRKPDGSRISSIQSQLTNMKIVYIVIAIIAIAAFVAADRIAPGTPLLRVPDRVVDFIKHHH